MGWAALSCRKMALKQRINALEQRLVNISQEEQSMYDAASYSQSVLNFQKTQSMNSIYSQYSNSMSQGTVGENASTQDLMDYNLKMQEAQMNQQFSMMNANSLFSAKEQGMQEAINNAETALETEKEQLETQLEAARAEYKSLDEAISNDIQDGAIKLA